MSEPRNNHLSIDGGQVKEDDHVASYKAIPESDTDFRTSKSSIGKSKEKVSPDGAEEKLLSKEDEAKIVRVDMADAKYIVGDHRNGDAKIELDANKRQFSGLTKEELMKYADDPFWVNLRWCMFVLFWAMWVAMLAGAITIIVRAPKCAPPAPRQWYEKYPIMESEQLTYSELQDQLPTMQSSLAQGLFVEVPAYEPAGSDAVEKFKAFAAKAKEYGVNVIVDLIPNFVPITHPWFLQSVNRSAPYEDYFIWANGTDFDEAGKRKPPNNWVSTYNTSAWTYNEDRKQFYLHQYREDQPDLNFSNEKVVAEFESALKVWMDAGAAGVRLNNARELLVNSSLADELPAGGSAAGADHTMYPYWRHRQASDQPGLDALFSKLAAGLGADGEKVFTVREESRVELFLLAHNMSALRPASAAPVSVREPAAAAKQLDLLVEGRWPLLQLKGDSESEKELALFAMLLPATPVLKFSQLEGEANDTTLSELSALRSDASLERGRRALRAVPAAGAPGLLLACARWKAGHTGYIGVFNPSGSALRANLTGAGATPRALSVHAVSRSVKLLTNYTKNYAERADNVLVPARSTVVLSYVPQTEAES